MRLDPFPLARPLLHALDAETAHALTLRILETGLVPGRALASDPILATSLFGRPLAHPLGLAAGFDKNARVLDRMAAMGFAWLEAGGVTPRPQTGNPRPRVFRLPRERAVVNRIGFANEGLEAVAARVRRRRSAVPLAINLAANVDSRDPADDFVRLARAFAPHADVLTLDVSCPNTENGRVFLEPAPLADLLLRVDGAVRESAGARRPAVVAKLGPDLDDSTLAGVVGVLRAGPADGIVASNTTLERPAGLRGAAAAQRGGLSGPPLRAAALRLTADLHRAVGDRLTIVGVGGIGSGADAYERICAGASVLQLYTAMIYDGPAVIGRVTRELAAMLRRDGHPDVASAVGVASR